MMATEWPAPDVRDARLAAHQCVWCGHELPADCASDDFCGDADMRGWLGSQNGGSAGTSGGPVHDGWDTASHPPGSAPTDLLSEPWYVPWRPLATTMHRVHASGTPDHGDTYGTLSG
jgi:hypothetical protein